MNEEIINVENLFYLKQTKTNLESVLLSIEKLNNSLRKMNEPTIDISKLSITINKTSETINMIQKFYKKEITLDELIEYRDNFSKN